MTQFNHKGEFNPPPALLPLLAKVKTCYLVWFGFYQTLPRVHKFSIGTRIDSLFIEIIEAIACASFLVKDEKLPWVRLAIRKLDTLRILLLVLWESKSIDNKKYLVLSVHIDEIGKMLGGWHGQINKQNSPTKTAREK